MNESNYSIYFRSHSLKYIEMALRSDKIGKIENPDGYGKRIGECGHTVEFFLTYFKNTLTNVSFCTKGCLNTTACCNTVAKFAQGKIIEEAWDVLPETVIEYLETLPDDHSHCAELAVGCFYVALSNLALITPSQFCNETCS